MAHPDEELVRGAFAAFGRGDLDALRDQYLAEGVRFHYPGWGALAGDHDGVREVLAVFGRAFELTGGTLHLELHDVIANDEHAVALYTPRTIGASSGKLLVRKQLGFCPPAIGIRRRPSRGTLGGWLLCGPSDNSYYHIFTDLRLFH